MQCSVTLARKHDFGHVKMKNFNNSYKKDTTNLDIKQLCNRLRDINPDDLSGIGMPSCSIEQAEAIRRYYEAFPALDKCRESCLPAPPPAWPAMASPPAAGKRRRHAPRRPRRKHKPQWLASDPQWIAGDPQWIAGDPQWIASDPQWIAGDAPEWLSEAPGDAAWDLDTHDPVREFIRALALHEARAPPPADLVPDWGDLRVDWALADEPEPPPTPLDSQLLESFKAKFDSLEALWAEPPPAASVPPPPHYSAPPPQPDLDRFELPIDISRLLASPEPDTAAVTDSLRSFAALNHSRDCSGFAEVPPRALRLLPPAPPPPPPAAPQPEPPRDDPLTSPRTHFRPIRREAAEARYKDGDTFHIEAALEEVAFGRSASGHDYLDGALYLEYRTRAIDYSRLRLTAAQRCPEMEDDGFRLRFAVRQRDAAAQTTPAPCAPAEPGPPAPREWDELAAEVAGARAVHAALLGPRARRQSAREPAPDTPAAPPACRPPPASFLHCGAERPLTR